MSKRDFLDLTDFSPEQVQALLDDAISLKLTPALHAASLKGKALAMIFEKPSLRTRVSFDTGIHQLGGFGIYLSPAEINLGKRESVPDVARTLDRMVQGIMVRTFSHRTLVELAEYAQAPVINGLTDFSHPCQALADYLTILEVKGWLEGLKLAYVGDGNNVVHSLIHGAMKLGVKLSIATPRNYEPNERVVSWAHDHAAITGASIELTHDAVRAVRDADVVYTDTWTSMGQESEAEMRRTTFAPYQVNSRLFSKTKSDAIFMHCLPAHRGEEVTDEIIDSPRSVVFHQAENRLHAQKAVLLRVMK